MLKEERSSLPGGDDEKLLSGILGSDLAEEEFMAGLVGERNTLSLSPTVEKQERNGQNQESDNDEFSRLCAKRKELGGVVSRRLKRGAENGRRALAEAQGAPELRAALRAVLSSISSAIEADNERHSTDDLIDQAFLQLSLATSNGVLHPDKSVLFDANGNSTQRASIEAACARARAEGRAEALTALAERERLREKCTLYKNRIQQLETKLASAQQWSDIPLDSPNTNKVISLEKELAQANDRLAALVGTERYAKVAALETELEERALIIAALRQALDQMPENTQATPSSNPAKLRYLPSLDTDPGSFLTENFDITSTDNSPLFRSSSSPTIPHQSIRTSNHDSAERKNDKNGHSVTETRIQEEEHTLLDNAPINEAPPPSSNHHERRVEYPYNDVIELSTGAFVV